MAYTFGYCSIPQFRAFQCSPVNGDSLASLVSFLVASGIFAAGTIICWTSKSLFRRRGVITGIALIIAAVYSAAVLGFSAFELSFSNPQGSWYITNISPDQGARIALFIPIYLLSLIPVLVLDLSTRISLRRSRMVLPSTLIGPFSALVDGRFSLGLSESSLDMTGFAILLFPMIVGVLAGWAILNGTTHKIIPSLGASDAVPSDSRDLQKRLRF